MLIPLFIYRCVSLLQLDCFSYYILFYHKNVLKSHDNTGQEINFRTSRKIYLLVRWASSFVLLIQTLEVCLYLNIKENEV